VCVRVGRERESERESGERTERAGERREEGEKREGI
jgi:hypothetical protein